MTNSSPKGEKSKTDLHMQIIPTAPFSVGIRLHLRMEWWLLSLYQGSDQEKDGEGGHNIQFQTLKSISVHTRYTSFLDQSS